MAGNFPSWRQALVTLGSGIVLGISTCGGMLSTFELESRRNENWFVLFTIGFLLSLGAVLVGVVFVLLRFVMDRRKRQGGPSG